MNMLLIFIIPLLILIFSQIIFVIVWLFQINIFLGLCVFLYYYLWWFNGLKGAKDEK